MPPAKSIPNGTKRKANDTPSNSSKKPKVSPPAFDHSRPEEEHGIVDRRFYPPQMSNERCQMYNANEIERPIETLQKAQEETEAQRENVPVKDAVVHWFKCDLRISDNKALHLAAEKAKSKGVPLICLHIISPQDYEAHVTSAVRVDFVLRTLEVLREDLAGLDIPLYVETVEKRKTIPNRILDLCAEWGTSHLYANMEYEVDELRREAHLTRTGITRNIAVHIFHDTCAAAPGSLKTGAGKQFSVYSPWFRAWLTYLKSHPHNLHLHPLPSRNPTSTPSQFLHLFNTPIPPAPSNRLLTSEEKHRFASLYPPGEHAAQDRLTKFLSEKAQKYDRERNFPSLQSTSSLSVHLASGTLSVRTAIAAARDRNTARALDSGNTGITAWISELAWRDFYKHVLAHWPYVCMSKPFKPEYSSIDWSYDATLFEKWCSGQTGYPFIDAAMRQLNETGYMHNRARMAVASFLAKDLLVDWRMGERYFMSRLIDGDFASNNGGWGFSASCGVDPQPYFRIFNPLLQGERFDAEGEFIRRWVPELRGVEGKAVHDPYGRGVGKTELGGYPRMCVVHKEVRGRALEMYKRGLGRDTA